MKLSRRIIGLAAAFGAAALTLGGMAPTLVPRVPPNEAKDISYFISIDGLQPALLKTLSDKGRLTSPKGLGWLEGTSFIADKAWPVITTLTAASHVSTVTCSPPSRHGIIANNFFLNGKVVSGFNNSFASEPLWRAAMRQGKKVLSLAYVGSDATTQARTPDFGLAYPDSALEAPAPTLSWVIADLPAAQGWKLPDGFPAGDYRQADVTLTLNPKTKESRTVHLLIDVAHPEAARFWLDDDKDLTNGDLGELAQAAQPRQPLDLFFVEQDPASTLLGAKRHVFFRTISASAPGKLDLYVSQASYNNAYPEAFRKTLDAQNLVWPDYGVRTGTLTLAEFVEAQAMIDRFLTKVGTDVAPALGVDIVLFYQPLIDTLGHKAQSHLPVPFDPDAADETTQAFNRAFQIVDEDVSALLSAGTGPTSVVELMGDHGMDAIRKAVNVAKVLPADHLGKINIIASGSLLLAYAPPGASADAAATADGLAQGLRDKLADLRGDDGRPALEGAVHKSDFPAGRQDDFRKEWQYGEALWALYSTSGYWFMYEPLVGDVFHDPPALGMHGTSETVPTMATTLLIHGPNVAPGHIPETSLINAVPTFTHLLGLTPPADCLGGSLL